MPSPATNELGAPDCARNLRLRYPHPGLYGEGYAAASAPVFDHEGTVRVVLTLLTDRKHTDLRLGGRPVQALRDAARRVTADIGGHGPGA